MTVESDSDVETVLDVVIVLDAVRVQSETDAVIVFSEMAVLV